MQRQRDTRDERVDGCTQEVFAVLDKWYPDRHSDTSPSGMEAHGIIASLIEHFNPKDTDCYEQCLNWVVDDALQPLFAKAEAHAKFIYCWLTTHGHDEGNKFEFNDLDNHAFIIPTAPMEVFCLTDQNCNYVVMLSTDRISTTFRVCRYWERWEVRDKHGEEEAQKFKDGGVPYMLTVADWWLERYSDHYPDLKQYLADHPDRPDLQWFKDKDFTDIGYGDTRDGCQVFSYMTLQGEPWKRQRDSIPVMRSIYNALFDLRVTREDMEARG